MDRIEPETGAGARPSSNRRATPWSCSLPQAPRADPIPRRSAIARWRVGVLITINLAIIAHIIHWWWTGRSLARFVLSDSMETLETGAINPGFLLFLAAILVTTIFGRLFCGWACHMGALQDFCAWLLRRIGIRPRLFRSRMLGYMPLGLALYMFVWPTLKRTAVAPTLARVWPSALAWFEVPAPIEGLSSRWTTDHLWAGLPSLVIALPFFILCGCATVYFLGARGLCRYGCPYGGFLIPAQRLAAFRVRVDPARCDQCGLCTAACTANVRVHDEVRLHRAVTDPNCIRSFDCVAICPTRALSFSPGAPAPFQGPAHARYDLTLGEEIASAGVCLVVFFTARGLYGAVPMLMAATIAVLAAFIAWKTMRVLLSENARLGMWVLRAHGKLTLGGQVFLVPVALLLVILVHSVWVRATLWGASIADGRVLVSLDAALHRRESIPLEQIERARHALALYTSARAWSHGGWALADNPESIVRIAWLELVVGRRDRALAELESIVALGAADDTVTAQLAGLHLLEGRRARAHELLEAATGEREGAPASRQMLSAILAEEGHADGAMEVWNRRLRWSPHDAIGRTGLARTLVMFGRLSEAADEFRRAAADAPRDATIACDLVWTLAASGQVEAAADHAESSYRSASSPAFARTVAQAATSTFEQAGRPDLAALWRARAAQESAK